MIEIGDRVTRSDRPDKFLVKRLIPCDDFKRDTQIWAIIENMRTGKESSINVEKLELIDDQND